VSNKTSESETFDLNDATNSCYMSLKQQFVHSHDAILQLLYMTK